MPDLILPGTIPGLLRRGSPVSVQWPDERHSHGAVVMLFDGPYVAVEPTGGEQRPYVIWPAGYLPHERPALALDLTDATGRAHAAWWLARHWPVGVAGKFTLLAGAMAAQHHQRAGRNVGVRFGPWATGEWLNWGSGLSDDRNVPALADLDPNDDRRLPDGSRWVDAEALRRVVLHVAGVSGA